MKITKVKYTEETLNWVSIEFEDGTKGQSSVLDGIRRQHTDVLQEYLDSGGVIEPQYTQAELDKQVKDKAKAEAKQYLADTDWMLMRELDGGKKMSNEVKQLRAEARKV